MRSETGNLTLAGLIDPAEADAIVDPDHYADMHDYGFFLASAGSETSVPDLPEAVVKGLKVLLKACFMNGSYVIVGLRLIPASICINCNNLANNANPA